MKIEQGFWITPEVTIEGEGFWPTLSAKGVWSLVNRYREIPLPANKLNEIAKFLRPDVPVATPYPHDTRIRSGRKAADLEQKWEEDAIRAYHALRGRTAGGPAKGN